MNEIVVGVDASPPASRALQHAVLEASSTGSSLRVINAWTTPVWLSTTGFTEIRIPDDSARWSQDLADEALAKCDHEGIEAIAEARQGNPGRVLVAAATDASLLVVGSNGHGYVASALLGSATGYVLHHTPCPVMIVPDGPPQTAYSRVVVGLDGSASSRAALRWALDATQRHDCPLVVVHGWRITQPPVAIPETDPPTHDFNAKMQSWLLDEVRLARTSADRPDVITVVRHGGGAVVLLGEAGPDDLLVVGSRGRGGFTGLLVGSVATQCAQHAKGVVVVVRAEGPATLNGNS